MKTLMMPSNTNQLDHFDLTDGFIVGIKNMSLYVPLTLTISELEELVPKIKAKNKKIFVSLNKLMYNQDIPLLKEYLLVIDKLKVDGIMYDDLSIFHLSKTLSLETPLVWFATHFFTNYHTANCWHKLGVEYGVISTEIAMDHIQMIKDNTNMKLMMYGYGYLPMFVSSRPLISSYFEHINEKKEDDLYYMYEEAHKASYPTYEDVNGTVILSSDILNSINELPILNNAIDYLIISSLHIPNNHFDNICWAYNEALNNLNDREKLKELSDLVTEESPTRTDKGFLYRETVYRVKNDGEN